MLWYLFYQSKTYNRKTKKKNKRGRLTWRPGQGPFVLASAQPMATRVVFLPAAPSSSLELGARRRRHGDTQCLLGLPSAPSVCHALPQNPPAPLALSGLSLFPP